MKYLQKSFSIGKITTDAYRDNYERAFSKTGPGPLPDPLQRDVQEAPTSLLREVTIRLPRPDFEALKTWAEELIEEGPLDPDVAHTVLMAVADAVLNT